MPIAALLLAATTPGAISPASVALRGTARAALSASAFPPGLSIIDEQGGAVGKVVSVEQGMVTIKTSRTLIRVPASAFVLRGGPVMVGVPAARLEALALTGLPTK